MSDPSFLLTTPTLTDPALAPPNRHIHYALFPAPNVRGRVDWRPIATRYRDEILETLEKRGYPGFGAGIEVEHLVTPADWAAMGLAAGAPFAAAHRSARPDRSGAHARPSDRRPGVLRIEHPARRRRADGADFGPARRRAHPVGRRPHDDVVARRARTGRGRGSRTPPCVRVTALPGDQRGAREDVLPRDAAAAAGEAAVRPRALRLRPARRRHRRRPRRPRRPTSAPSCSTVGRRLPADLEWGATSDPISRAVIDTSQRWEIPSATSPTSSSRCGRT